MSIFNQKIFTILYLIIIIIIISSIGYFITNKESFETKSNTFLSGNVVTPRITSPKPSIRSNVVVSGNINIPTSKPPITSNVVVSGNVSVHSLKTITGNTSVPKYDSNNYDVQYHDNISDLQKQNGIYDSSFGKMYVKDPSGNLVSIAYVEGQALPTYYQPGSFVFSPSNYVPNYEDSVYLSRTTGLSTLGKVKSVATMQGGFCNQMANDKTMLESKCNSISTDVCASTSCCVLVGGSKCTSGNENGPVTKSIYSDPTIKNKDYYYYQGKCYGNCL